TFAKGTNTVTCLATDAAGNTNTCSFKVIVHDVEPPVITCPQELVLSTDAGQCSRSNVTYAATATDLCSAVTVVCAPPSGSTFPKGTNTVNCTATDAAGNTATCSFKVSINDSEVPVVTCPADLVTNSAPASSSQVVYYAVDVSDNCPGATVSCSPASGSTFPAGISTVNCVASDAAGNTNHCSFTVTVEDAPVANTDALGALVNHPVTVLAEKLLANDTAPAGRTLTLLAVSATSTNGGTVVLSGG